jgi:hypothetical protein
VVCAAGGILGILVGMIAGLVLRYSGMTVIFSVTPAASPSPALLPPAWHSAICRHAKPLSLIQSLP